MRAKRLLYSICFLLGLMCMAGAKTVEASENAGYLYFVFDEGDYLTEEEEQSLVTILRENVTEGNGLVLVASDVGNRSSEEDTIRYAKSKYVQYCSYSDGMIFVIDMSTRYIELVTMESYVDKISNYTAANICDGVYQYASAKDYYSCCASAVMLIGVETGAGARENVTPDVKVPKSMHIVTNILLALAIALILNFYLLKFLSRTPEADAKALAGAADVNIQIEPGNHVKTHTEHLTHELGSIEGIVCTHNWFGKLIHLICFILIVAFRILAGGGSSGGGGGRSGGSSGGGRSGGGGHRF